MSQHSKSTISRGRGRILLRWARQWNTNIASQMTTLGRRKTLKTTQSTCTCYLSSRQNSSRSNKITRSKLRAQRTSWQMHRMRNRSLWRLSSRPQSRKLSLILRLAGNRHLLSMRSLSLTTVRVSWTRKKERRPHHATETLLTRRQQRWMNGKIVNYSRCNRIHVMVTIRLRYHLQRRAKMLDKFTGSQLVSIISCMTNVQSQVIAPSRKLKI